MVGSAVVGGVLLAMIEGVSILFNRFAAEQFKPGKCYKQLVQISRNTYMTFSCLVSPLEAEQMQHAGYGQQYK